MVVTVVLRCSHPQALDQRMGKPWIKQIAIDYRVRSHVERPFKASHSPILKGLIIALKLSPMRGEKELRFVVAKDLAAFAPRAIW